MLGQRARRQARRASGRERVTISLDRVTMAEVRALAVVQGRAVSNMLASLVRQALDARSAGGRDASEE